MSSVVGSKAVGVDAAWAELVTAALLGTDRRPVPELPTRALADLVDDAVLADPAERMLAAVAAVGAARRAAFVPHDPAPALQPPPDDPRPLLPVPAAATWRAVIAEWPVLEDEWMLTALAGGWRLPADVLVDALIRHRGDPVRRARVGRVAGPIAGWLVNHEPALAATNRRSVASEAVLALSDLPVPPEWTDLLTADALSFGRTLSGIVDGATPSLKPVLVNLLARCRPAVLGDAGTLLAAHPTGLALALADLARLRARMLVELTPPR